MRNALDWSQDGIGRFLGVSQRVAWAIESGRQEETGPIAFLLDILSIAIGAGRVAKGVSPGEAREAVLDILACARVGAPEPREAADFGCVPMPRLSHGS